MKTLRNRSVGSGGKHPVRRNADTTAAPAIALSAMLAVAALWSSAAQAAIAPNQAFPTDGSGSGGTTVGSVLTRTYADAPGFDITYRVVSHNITPGEQGCRLTTPGYLLAGQTDGLTRSVYTYTEPDSSDNILQTGIGCSGGNMGVQVTFSKPVVAPILSLNNIDGGYLNVNTVAPTVLVRNPEMDVQDYTSFYRYNEVILGATGGGCHHTTLNPNSNGACGSFRLRPIAGGTLVSGFAMTTVVNPAGDSQAFWVSFPIAPVTKQFAPSTIAAGQTSQLTFTISNPADPTAAPLSPLDFTDALPAGMTLASPTATNNGQCGSFAITDGSNGPLDVGDTSISVQNIALAVGATCTVTVTVTAPAGTYTNNSSNMSSSVGNVVPNANATLTVLESSVDLSITKTDGAATYVPGFDVNYTIVVSNTGPGDVVGAQISDPLPAGISDASWTCGNATNGGVCGAASGTGAIATTADLPAGASVTYTMSLGVPIAYTGNLTNTATVAAPGGVTETNLDNNEASDTNTMEPPPTSGACSPRVVVQGASFTLAPFPTNGTVAKTAANGWNPDNPWATRGGNYTFRWTFSQPVPVSWIRFAVIDVNETAGIDYDANPPVFTITLAGGTATTADFTLADGDLIYSGGALRFRPGGPYRQSGHLQGNGGDTVTSITIVSTGVSNGDNIANSLYVRPACVTLQKTSEGGTGSFQINMSNVVQANGTAVPATTLATTAPNTPVSSPEYYSIINQNVALSEVVPASWNLDSAICTDQNAGRTGNPQRIGTFASPAITIPADNVRPEADIRCLFTNELLPAADLAVVKTVAPNQVFSGQQVVYTLQVTNNGPESADGALLTDPQPVGLDCSAGTLTCGSATGGAVCPASPTIAQLQGTGVPIPTLPTGGSVAFTLTCTVTASGRP